MKCIVLILFFSSSLFAYENQSLASYQYEQIDHYIVFQPKKNQYLYRFLESLGVPKKKRMPIVKEIQYFNREIKDEDIIAKGEAIYIPKLLFLKAGIRFPEEKHPLVERQPAAAQEPVAKLARKVQVGLLWQFSTIDAVEKVDNTRGSLESNLGYGFWLQKEWKDFLYLNLQYLRESFDRAEGKSLNNASSDRLHLGIGSSFYQGSYLTANLEGSVRQVNYLMASSSTRLDIRKVNLPVVSLLVDFAEWSFWGIRFGLFSRLHYYFASTDSGYTSKEALSADAGFHLSLKSHPQWKLQAQYEELNMDTSIHRQRYKDLFLKIIYHWDD